MRLTSFAAAAKGRTTPPILPGLFPPPFQCDMVTTGGVGRAASGGRQAVQKGSRKLFTAQQLHKSGRSRRHTHAHTHTQCLSGCHKSGLTNALNTHTQAHTHTSTHAQAAHLHKETEEQ